MQPSSDQSSTAKPQPDQQDHNLTKLKAKRNHLDKVSRLLDDAFTLPGTRITIGWDAIIGLIPVAGDVIGALLSGYLILQGMSVGLPKSTVFRMLLNIAVELLLGMVPVLGDLFDVTWRANRKNYELIDGHIEHRLQTLTPQAQATKPTEPSRHRSSVWQFVLGLICFVILVLALWYFSTQQLTTPFS